MACRDAYETQTKIIDDVIEVNQSQQTKAAPAAKGRLYFGVDSTIPADDVLQNNITLFDWAARNKIYPNFWGRNIAGENCLTKEEVEFLYKKGCKIAAIFTGSEAGETNRQGQMDARRAVIAAIGLGIPENTAIFLEIGEDTTATASYMRGFAQGLLRDGYTPGFKANTDANYGFDREFSAGLQLYNDEFKECIVWATAPTVEEYNGITTTHIIHPDHWKPFAPSGMTRDDISVWQYGNGCHPIHDDAGTETSFNIDLVRDAKVIIDKMF